MGAIKLIFETQNVCRLILIALFFSSSNVAAMPSSVDGSTCLRIYVPVCLDKRRVSHNAFSDMLEHST